MITKNHSSAYAELFKKAQDALQAHGGEGFQGAKIGDIDDYFSCLAELARIENETRDSSGKLIYDPIFTILPATEETFKIDANTRDIEIPDNFSKHGVGVQGDEIAEILYFSIDRYFDAMDLADMDILIQWKHEKDTSGLESLSATYKKSLTLQPGKIVFGWPITAEITEQPGNIKFSVRFYRRNNNELIYSFSTQTKVIKIISGLDFSINEDTLKHIDDRSSQIYANLRNSSQPVIDYIIASPAFTNYYVLKEGEENPSETDSRNYDLGVTFIAKAEIPANTPSDERVDGTGLKYKWIRKDRNNNIDDSIEPAYYYYEINPESNDKPNPYEIYYTKAIVGGESIYEAYYNDNNPFDDDVTLYVRCAKCVPQKAGVYYAIASNVYNIGKVKEAISEEFTVPFAEYPVLLAENDIVNLLETDASVELRVDASVADNGNMTYQWYYGEENTFNKAEAINGATTTTLNAYNEGYYFLKAVNDKNADKAESISKEIWVKHFASTPIINAFSAQVVQGEPFTVTLGDLAYSERIEFTWVDENNNTVAKTDINSYTPKNTGYYKCTVTNHYKGTASSTEVTNDWMSVTPN